jgi:hypothetical protein
MARDKGHAHGLQPEPKHPRLPDWTSRLPPAGWRVVEFQKAAGYAFGICPSWRCRGAAGGGGG